MLCFIFSSVHILPFKFVSTRRTLQQQEAKQLHSSALLLLPAIHVCGETKGCNRVQPSREQPQAATIADNASNPKLSYNTCSWQGNLPLVDAGC